MPLLERSSGKNAFGNALQQCCKRHGKFFGHHVVSVEALCSLWFYPYIKLTLIAL